MKIRVNFASNGIEISNELHFLKSCLQTLNYASDDLKAGHVKEARKEINLSRTILSYHIKLIHAQDKLLKLREQSGYYKEYVDQGYLIK